MKHGLTALVILLAGCTTAVPVKQKWPDAPAELLERCQALQKADPNKPAITDLLKTVVENYGLYYQCSLKVEGWNEWYLEQKRIFEKANK